MRPADTRLALGLVGFGHVGRRFVRLLEECGARLRDEHGLACTVIGIVTARHGAACRAGGLDIRRALDLTSAGRPLTPLHDEAAGPPPAHALELIRALPALAGSRPCVLIETSVLDIARGQPAIDHVRAALAAGCHVVTANKGPVAHAWRVLRAEAERADRAFLFEGAVMDGIPVFGLVRETLPAVEILGFRGVINSTTNHLLTELEAGRDLQEALAEMQAAGIAEADASLDVDGWDAAAKTAALANVLMEGDLTPAAVRRTGIGHVTAAMAQAALHRGRRLKLVASAVRRTGRIEAAVEPVELDAADLLGGLSGTANALVLATDLLGELAITELNGGLTQTAYALVADLVTVARRQQGLRAAAARRSP